MLCTFQGTWQPNPHTCSKRTFRTQCPCLCVERAAPSSAAGPSLTVQFPLGAASCLPGSSPSGSLPAFSLLPLLTLERKLTNGSNYHSGLRLLDFLSLPAVKMSSDWASCSARLSTLFNAHLNLMSSWCLWKTLLKFANSRLTKPEFESCLISPFKLKSQKFSFLLCKELQKFACKDPEYQ